MQVCVLSTSLSVFAMVSVCIYIYIEDLCTFMCNKSVVMQGLKESERVVFELCNILALKECLKHSLIINLRYCNTSYLKC